MPQNVEKKALHPSIIGVGLTVTGDLVSDGEIQIDGCVRGDIRCKSLVVGLSGEVVGEVCTAGLRVHGQLTGQVHADSVFLAATAHMIGDVYHQSLAIEPGAFLQGLCRRCEESALTEQPVAAIPQITAEPGASAAAGESGEVLPPEEGEEPQPRRMTAKTLPGLAGAAS